jgi:hypothetical protein
MSRAQTWLIVGGMFNLVFSSFAAYLLFWLRLRDPHKKMPRYGLITHTSSITMGLVLIALSVVIEQTHFSPKITLSLAIAAVVSTLLSDLRNLSLWAEGLEDGFGEVSETRRRLRGLGNALNLMVMVAIFYGIVRTALGF